MEKPYIVLLVVENREYILTEYVKYLLKLSWNKSVQGIIFWEGKRKPIWYMRRKLIESALEKKECTHVLFIDTDVIPPDDFIMKLLFFDCDIISGVYFDTADNPCSRKNNDYYLGKYTEDVDVCSMGASLIKRKVLETVSYPCPDNPTIDADKEFCREVKKKGFTIKQNFELRCSHLLLGEF